MAFGIYVHIPFCLQICPYCDFTKYRMGTIMAPKDYVDLILKEIRQKAALLPNTPIETVYFGGGTPSLFDPQLILSILDELANVGLPFSNEAEITLEIDPTTVDAKKLDSFLKIGINRFSVGAQTFNNRLLSAVGRKHSSTDIVELLNLLSARKTNYSIDLLFALPTQTLAELADDIEKFLGFNASHVSAYCLTIPEGHKLSPNRAPDEEQIEMFDLIEQKLAAAGIFRYEISNYAKPGFESKHNLLYWTDQSYLGLGVSAHSYFAQGISSIIDQQTQWGSRFWNSKAIKIYEHQISCATSPLEQENQLEILEKHQSLTDYCHTSLRLTRGLSLYALRLKFGNKTATLVEALFIELENSKLTERTESGWTLTQNGRLLSNLVFEKLTFLANEIA
jgi:oxygen-independent coproporphyrinogen-3 oxidase